MLSSCPFCHRNVPSAELEWHADGHFADDLEQDAKLALEMAFASSSPPTAADALVNHHVPFVSDDGGTVRVSCSSTSRSFEHSEKLEEEISCLIGMQSMSPFHYIEGGLMNLLSSCLNAEDEPSRSVISGHVDHYQSIPSEDYGFGCGWRNIQMLSSYLLKERPEMREVLFGGSRFVPEIAALQRWLEIAWEKGFDVEGSQQLQKAVYGSRKWIGTTECAALFRSFGLRARVVDFESKSVSKPAQNRQKKAAGLGFGPMDKFLQKNGDYQAAATSSSAHIMTQDNQTELRRGHETLINWVWNYFASNHLGNFDSSPSVIVSPKTPLYFQHDGHSRTIVGIQFQKGRHEGSQVGRHVLLVLDPGHRSIALEKALREGKGWERMIKRGVDSLKKSQYQVCYVDPGIAANPEELEHLKIIDSVKF